MADQEGVEPGDANCWQIDPSDIETRAADALLDTGLEDLGWFRDEHANACLLIGNSGSGFWQHFSASRFVSDGLPDPLDRWTREVLFNAARKLDCSVYFPFEEPFKPFQKWACDATGAKASPLGILLHPRTGLWWALRGAFCFPRELEVRRTGKLPVHACVSCADKPCLAQCPVNAFTEAGFDHKSCRTFLAANETSDCRSRGCQARLACPIAEDYRYMADHHRFHLTAFAHS